MNLQRRSRATSHRAALPTGGENGGAAAAAAKPYRVALPDLRVVLGGSGRCYPGSEKQHGATFDRSPSRETAGAALAGRVALVVDDEPMILEILSEFCASLGMKVYEAPDGEGALRKVETNPEIEVLVTDIRMPGLDGPGLVSRVLGLRPEIKVIFVTGYATYRSAAWPTLRKPFDLDELEDAVRRALLQQGPAPE
jgi:CheY-like chemotaxis protein